MDQATHDEALVAYILEFLSTRKADLARRAASIRDLRKTRQVHEPGRLLRDPDRTYDVREPAHRLTKHRRERHHTRLLDAAEMHVVAE